MAVSAPREAGAVGAGAFDAERVYDTVLGRPGRHLAIAVTRYRERCGSKPRAQSVDRNGYVNVFVSIDFDNDSVGCNIMHAGPPGRWNPRAICERTGL